MSYYVKIDDPKAFRREVLESSKETISCLQSLRDVLYVRKRKKEMILLLQKQIKEIDLLLGQLEKVLPEKQLREEAIKQAREAELEKKREEKESSKKTTKKSPKKSSKSSAKKNSDDEKAVDKPPAKKQPSEMEKLNDALSSIEDKLASLK